VLGTESTQLEFEGVDPGRQVVNEGETLHQVRLPRFGQRERVEQLTAGDAEQVGHRAGTPERDEDRVDPVLEGAPMPDQMEPEAGPLPFRAHLWRRQPDLRDQRPTGELGEHPSVDLVGLRREGRQAPHPLGVRDEHLPAQELEAVVDEAGAVHRLDRRPHRLSFSCHPSHERSHRIPVR
jgi:hypothetical protein